MANPYAVPKHAVQVVVTLEDGASSPMRLYLGDRAEGHAGPERPSDLLNGSQRFLPAAGPDGDLIFLQRGALVVIAVPEEHEAASALEAGSETSRVEVTLADGSSLRGEVRYALPEAHRRLQDHLNGDERFLALREPGLIRFINKDRIARVRRLGPRMEDERAGAR